MLFCGSSKFLKFFMKKIFRLTLSGFMLTDNEECSTSQSELDVSVVLHRAFGSALRA